MTTAFNPLVYLADRRVARREVRRELSELNPDRDINLFREDVTRRARELRTLRTRFRTWRQTRAALAAS